MKSKLEHYESSFVKSVKNAIDELLEVTSNTLPSADVNIGDYSIEGYSPDNNQLYTLVFRENNHSEMIIGWVDYEIGFGITGYELSDIDEPTYFDLAGCLLAWQSETLFQIQEGK